MMDLVYASPRGVHVPPQAYAYSSSLDSGYAPGVHPSSSSSQRRNRYSRSLRQTPRARDVTWVSAPESTAPRTPRMSTSQGRTSPRPLSPGGGMPLPQSRPPSQPPSPRPASYRTPSAIQHPPSPAPTVGEHMALDDGAFTLETLINAYHGEPKHPSASSMGGGGGGLIKSLWKGLKKLSGINSRRSSYQYGDPMMSMPMPLRPMPEPDAELSEEEATQYVHPTPSATPTPSSTEEHHRTRTPPSTMPAPAPSSIGRSSPVLQYTSPHAGATHITVPTRHPSVLVPGSIRGRRSSVPSVPASALSIVNPPSGAAPPITIVSPSNPPSSLPDVDMPLRSPSLLSSAPPGRPISARRSSPSRGVPRHPAMVTSRPPDAPIILPAPTVVLPPHVTSQPSVSMPVPSAGDRASVMGGDDGAGNVSGVATTAARVAFPSASISTSSTGGGSLSSAMARVRRFVTSLDELPWVSDAQIADEYVPEMTARSRLRSKIRRGTEPAWYSARPKRVDRMQYDWSEWDVWAKQSTPFLWDGVAVAPGAVPGVGMPDWGGGGQPWGPVYPHGYTPGGFNPALAYPSGYPPPGVLSDHGHVQALPMPMP